MALVAIFSDAATMKPNTAIAVILVALAVILRLPQTSNRILPRMSHLLCLVALVLGAATLAEYLTGHSIGIDQLVLRTGAEPSSDPAGRMSIGTAINIVLSSVAMLSLDAAPVLGRLLSAGSGLLSLSALVGILFGAGPLYGVLLLRSMSVRTAGCFFSLHIAYLLMRPAAEPLRSLIITTRRHRTGVWFFLATCALPLLVGWPIAAATRRDLFGAPFAFALLIVLLMAMQTLLVASNSRSLADADDRRASVEHDRHLLAAENMRQSADLDISHARAAKSEALYQLITDNLPALVSYLDTDLRYVRVNRAYQEWFGVSPAKVQGKSLSEVLGASTENVHAQLMAALAGEPQAFETTMDTLQGQRTVFASYQPDFDGAGGVRGVVVLVSDVTANRQAEVALRQTEKLAALGKLSSSIAHEINNPLEAVTNLFFLARHSAGLEEAQQFLAMAENELQRVSDIASRTLRFHRQRTSPSAVCLDDILRAVLTMYQSRLSVDHITVTQRLRATRTIVCLEGEIRQVLNNLIGNAIEALPAHVCKLMLRSRDAVDPRTGQPGVLLTIADTGSGMTAKTQGALYEPFFTTKGANGSGLGLWVSKEIIDRHQGRIAVRSSQRPGQCGTVFRLFLPNLIDPSHLTAHEA